LLTIQARRDNYVDHPIFSAKLHFADLYIEATRMTGCSFFDFMDLYKLDYLHIRYFLAFLKGYHLS